MFDRADLEAFVRGLIEEKKYETFDDDEINDMVDELLANLTTQIDIACVSQLSEEKANELNEKLEQSDMSNEEIADFMKANNVNIEETTSDIKNRFKEVFLAEISEGTEEGGEE